MFRPERVDRVRNGGLGFSLVDRRIGGGIDDNVGTFACDRRSDGLFVGKIEFRAADRDHLNTGASRFHKAARQLALTAGDENLHLASCFTAPGGRSRLPARPSRSPA